MAKHCNIALMAHVDAGKTTLTERLLYDSGAIRTLGSVNDGTATTDNLAVERARGISVRAAFTSFTFDDMTVNMIDTPGHADFYSQVEQSFKAIDAAVILVSAVDGIQPGTEILISEAIASGMPIVFFINKCDRDTADVEKVVSQIKAICGKAYFYKDEAEETAAMHDDVLAQDFLEGGSVKKADVNAELRKHLIDCPPILSGSAYTGEGVEQLLDVIKELVSVEESSSNSPPSGVVFAVEHNKGFGRGAYIRMFEGELAVRDSIEIGGMAYRISMIKRQENRRWIDAKELRQGDIGLVYGINNAKTGDTFGGNLPQRVKSPHKEALLSAQVKAENEADETELKAALEIMTAEDPTLALEFDSINRSMHIGVMGAVQMETLPALIEERFGIKAVLAEPEVIYKETLAKPTIGFDAYTMPKPCWAVLKFEMKPSQRGGGVTYRCTAPPNRLPYRYREQVELSIEPSLKQGPLGWEVTDIDINLIDGEDHHVHTHPLDFTIATPLAIADGLRNGGTVLLEPILSLRMTFDSAYLGRVMSDVIKMRGEAESQIFDGGNVTIHALIPLATSLDYPISFASLTSGTGTMLQKLHGYRECPLELGKKRQRIGVDPADRSKYILAARNAISGKSVF